MPTIKNQDDFLEGLINPLAETFEQVNTDVLTVISARIKSIGAMTPTDAHKLSILIKNGDLDEIERIISDGTKLSINQIDSIVQESASYNDELASELYKARNLPLSTIATNTSLLNVVETAKKNIVDNVVNLSKTSVTNLVINGKSVPIKQAYNYAVNRAVFEVQQGLFDFNTAMRSSIRSLADGGVRTIDYESGLSRRLDSAIRLNIREGISTLNTNYREIQGKEFGSDGIELSVHALSEPIHGLYQGKQFSHADFEKLQASLQRPFFTNNCRHSSFPIILGVSKQIYSNDELKQIEKNSNKQVEYTTLQKDSGGNYIKKSLSRYDFSQKQRAVETDIRRLKDTKNQFDILGDKIGSSQEQKKIAAKTKYYKMISEQGGLSPKLDKLRIVK